MPVIIVAGHGSISKGMIDAFEMIYGHDKNVRGICFKEGEHNLDLRKKFEKVISEYEVGEEFLFLVDLYSGTPYNTAALLALENKKIDVVSGVSLPMVLEAATLKESQSLKTLALSLKESISETVKIFSEEAEKNIISDEDDCLNL